MLTHEDLVQGTPAWDAHRKSHRNASDAPAMMGCSPYKSRSELLHECWLHLQGLAVEKTLAVGTQRRFADGHRFEKLCRPLAEVVVGEALYPVVGSKGKLSASFDGLTMAETINWEHKSLNEELRTAMVEGCTLADLPLMYRVQVEQQHAVSDAEKTLFSASKWDGDNLVEVRHCWGTPDLELRAQIIAGWEQFEQDLAAYVPPEVIVPAVAAPQMGLPAVSITVNGSIALVDNLDKFGAALTAYVERINKKPETDQDFADLEATVKTLKTAEDALDAAESNALAQTDSIDAMRRTVALYRDTARTNRLLVTKLVTAEKENRRIAIVHDAIAALAVHVVSLDKRIGKPYMPAITGDFQGAIKGLKSLDSMKDKVSTELARCKIAANETADRIQANLETKGLHGYAFLFADLATLCQKAPDDFAAVVSARITAHEAAEAKKEADTRERIRAEEQAKAEQAAREKLATEQAERDRIAAEAAKVERIVTAPDSAPVTPPGPAAATVPFEAVVALMPATVRQAMAPKPAETPPTLALGEISTRLGFNCTSAFLATLGFEATTVKAAKLYHPDDFPAICQALIAHISEVSEQFDAVTA